MTQTAISHFLSADSVQYTDRLHAVDIRARRGSYRCREVVKNATTIELESG